MNKQFLTLTFTTLLLTSCSIINERNTERLYKEATDYKGEINFTEEEREADKIMSYCNAYALAHSFYVTDSDTYQSLTEKLFYYKMADIEKYNEVVNMKNACYESHNITDEDIEKVNKKLEERIEYLKKGTGK